MEDLKEQQDELITSLLVSIGNFFPDNLKALALATMFSVLENEYYLGYQQGKINKKQVEPSNN